MGAPLLGGQYRSEQGSAAGSDRPQARIGAGTHFGQSGAARLEQTGVRPKAGRTPGALQVSCFGQSGAACLEQSGVRPKAGRTPRAFQVSCFGQRSGLFSTHWGAPQCWAHSRSTSGVW